MAKVRPVRMTADSRILLRCNGNSHITGMMNQAVLEESRRESAKYKYNGRIKPSSLSLDMCFDEYYKTCDVYRKWSLALKLSFLYGNAIHSYIGKYLQKNYPESYFQPNVPLRAMRWYEQAFPEVPIVSDKWHSKAVIDYVARISAQPVIIDWKTCHHDDESWAKFVEKPWISPTYLMQAASYCFLANDMHYFPEPVTKFGFVFINMVLEPSDEFMWHEVYYDYAPYAPLLKVLWEMAVECVEAKLAGKTYACKNQYCKTHGSGRPGKLISQADPWHPVVPLAARQDDCVLGRSNQLFDRVRELLEGDPEDIYEQELMEAYKCAEFW